MFTGLVQQSGIYRGLDRRQGGWAIRISYKQWPDPLELGESVAVQGACLTVISDHDSILQADLLDETLRRTALGNLKIGSRVNLERALAVGERLGGHLVTGHVDECGILEQVCPAGRDQIWRIRCSRKLAQQTVEKGSVTIDGVSLTVSALGDTWVEVNLIPHTLAATSLCERRVGDPINLEGDLIGKYVARLLGVKAPSITEELLAENGFI